MDQAITLGTTVAAVLSVVLAGTGEATTGGAAATKLAEGCAMWNPKGAP